ncbi:hypothetical protein FRAHR75_50041 [Frankia sp. Hr75.2]|nr:hypothetical protein FRAHR75_50041 [Frankia sp. Hr75.2]SQD95540.1 hypothetical protein FMEAI12_3220035 [Parafrankia sp. Ea1.12]
MGRWRHCHLYLGDRGPLTGADPRPDREAPAREPQPPEPRRRKLRTREPRARRRDGTGAGLPWSHVSQHH